MFVTVNFKSRSMVKPVCYLVGFGTAAGRFSGEGMNAGAGSGLLLALSHRLDPTGVLLGLGVIVVVVLLLSLGPLFLQLFLDAVDGAAALRALGPRLLRILRVQPFAKVAGLLRFVLAALDADLAIAGHCRTVEFDGQLHRVGALSVSRSMRPSAAGSTHIR